MPLFKKLFGGGDGTAAKAPVEMHEGFRITLAPEKEGNAYRVGALIEKEVDGELKTHHLIRADTMQGLEAAQDASLRKAKQAIDEQGERIFR